MYLKTPLVVFCIAAVISYVALTYYNEKKCSDETKKFSQNDIYMYTFGVALIVSGVVYLLYPNKTTDKPMETIEQEPLQNRPVLNKTPEFFETPKKSSSRKGPEKVMTEPFFDKM